MNERVFARLERNNAATEDSVRPRPIGIFLLGNPSMYLEGLKSVVAQHQQFELSACVSPGEQCVQRYSECPAPVLLIHVNAAQRPVRDLFAAFLAVNPQLNIALFGDDVDRRLLRECIRAGGRGFIEASMSAEELARSLLDLAAGKMCFGRQFVEDLVANYLDLDEQMEMIIRARAEALREAMTAREYAVFEYVLEGLSTREIAERLNLSEQSIKLRLSRLFRKFDARNRSQLILIAFETVCPVSNIIRLFRSRMDKRCLRQGRNPVIDDPLEIPPNIGKQGSD